MPQISNTLTVLAIVNGMLGGALLVIPVISRQISFFLILLTCIAMGLACLATQYYLIDHLTIHKTIEQSLMAHFRSKNYIIAYHAICICAGISTLMIYFNLIIKQILGLLSIKQGFQFGLKQWVSTYLPYALAISLLAYLILMDYFQLNTNLAGIGIVTIIAYCLFILWVYFCAQQSKIYREQQYNLSIKDFLGYVSTITFNFEMQIYLIPILQQNQNKNLYKKLTSYAYGIGIILTIFFSLSSRVLKKMLIIGQPETIQDYFTDAEGNTNWQVSVIQLIYLAHLLTVFPQFTINVKNRIIMTIKIVKGQNISESFKSINSHTENSQNQNQSWFCDSKISVIIHILVIGIALLIEIFKIKVTKLLQISGAVASSFDVFFVPIFIHFSCLVLFKSCFYSHQTYSLIQNDNFSKENQQLEAEEDFSQFGICPQHKNFENKSRAEIISEFTIMALLFGLGISVLAYVPLDFFSKYY